MTIEAQLKAINDELKRIADNLEGLLAEQGVVPEPKAKPATKKAAKKKTSKKTVGKKADDDDDGAEFEFSDVRNALKKLKAEVSQAAVKSLLKKYGASTIGQVDDKDYGRLIADAEEQLE